MTWAALVKKVAFLAKPKWARKPLTVVLTHRVLTSVFNAIAEDVLHGGRVVVPGFGTFYLQRRAARRIRNPATHDLMVIPETIGIGFRCSRSIKR